MSNFKKVLRTCLLFILVVAIFSFCIMEVFFYGENYYYQDIREREEVSGTIDYIVLGSSQAMRALNPTILDEDMGTHSYNLSIANITMQGRYEMLKLELDRNPVDTVILDVSYNTLTKNREYRGYEGDYYVLAKLDLMHRIPYFFESIRPSEYVSIYSNFLNKGLTCLDKAVHGTWTDKNTKINRGYMAYDHLRSQEGENFELTTNYAEIYNTKVLADPIYEPNMEYLRKILDLCEGKDVQVIMTSIPLSKSFICTYSGFDTFRVWYEEIAEEYEIPFYDFNLYKENENLYNDMVDFHDVQHFNNKGAEQFSHQFANIMNRVESGEDIDNLFYDNYEELKTIYKSEFENDP